MQGEGRVQAGLPDALGDTAGRATEQRQLYDSYWIDHSFVSES
jgi:hypothetical protein